MENMIPASEAFQKLCHLEYEIKDLLRTTMESLDYGEVDDRISYDKTPDGYFFKSEFRDILDKLQDTEISIDYLKKPIKEEGRLHVDDNGRYALNDFDYHCGYTIEILIYDDFDECDKWVLTRIEATDSKYYAVGYKNVCLDGIKVRRR